MFCARCGQQIADASEICPLCGREANIHLPPQPEPASYISRATAPGQPALLSSTFREELQGVRGWLLWFCIVTAILTPLGNAGALMRFAAAGSPWTLYYGVLVTFSLLVGVSVWRTMPSAISVVKAYFISFAAWELARITYVVITGPGQGLDTQMVFRIRALVWITIWAAYFHKSQRVRATFGRNL